MQRWCSKGMNNDAVKDSPAADACTEPRHLAARLGVEFNNPLLLEMALTHASSLTETAHADARDYEALEFLGDAVLQMAVSHQLIERLPMRTPGEYTKLRATLVNRNSVARVAQRLDIAPYIRLGKGEETVGGRKRTALLADCLEAIVGAVYLDAGWETARALVLRLFADEFEDIVNTEPCWDYKSRLQTYCQAERFSLPHFEVVNCEGPDHRKQFEVEVRVCGRPLGRGRGMSKKEAEQNAAHEALQALKVFE